MAFSNQNRRSPDAGSYACNGAITSFSGTFYIQSADQAKPYLVDSLGVETEIASYTITPTGGSYPADTFTLETAETYATGFGVYILRNVEYVQEDKFGNQGPYLSKVVEDNSDYQMMAMQQISEELDRCVKNSAGAADPVTDPQEYLQECQSAAARAEAAIDGYPTAEVYLSSYGSLSTAVSIIGATEVTLVVDKSTSESVDVTISENITLRPVNGNLIGVDAGATLTLNCFIDAGNYKIFGSILGSIDGALRTGRINVAWFGANEDSVNSAPLIEAAISIASSTGVNSVYIPGVATHYSVTSSITPVSGVDLIGDGKTSKLKVTGASSFNIIDVIETDISDVVFDGLSFDGSQNYPSDSKTYKQTYALGNRAINIAQDASGTYSASNIIIRNCFFNELSSESIDINSMSMRDIRVHDNYFYKGSYMAAVINIRLPNSSYTYDQRATGIQICDNYIDTCGPQIFWDASKEDYVASSDGITIDSANSVTIANNHVESVASIGIRIEESLNVTVEANTVLESGNEGITFYKNSYDCSCVGNTVKNWGRTPPAYAIRLYSGSYYVFRSFPDATYAPISNANPTGYSYVEAWPYSLDPTVISPSSIITYAANDYYVGVSDGILPFRGFAAIDVQGGSARVNVVGNSCDGNLETDGSGDYKYASDFGFSVIHPINSPDGPNADDSQVVGNNFRNYITNRIYHPKLHEAGKGGNPTVTGAVSYVGNSDYDDPTDNLVDFDTFTASLTPGAGSITMGNNELTYTKIGKLVHVIGELTISSVSSPSGAVTLSTLPFRSATSRTDRQGITSGALHGYSFTGSPSGVLFYTINAGATTATIQPINDFIAADLGGYMQSGTTIDINITYLTD
jgi:hypothetical protein